MSSVPAVQFSFNPHETGGCLNPQGLDANAELCFVQGPQADPIRSQNCLTQQRSLLNLLSYVICFLFINELTMNITFRNGTAAS